MYLIPLLANIEHKLQWVLQAMDIGKKGYVVLFALLFSCGVGVPIPEDIPLLVAGALVGSGHMQVVPAAALAWCGIIGGDCLLYYFGRRYGLNITKVPFIGKHVTKSRILRAERLFEHYGVGVVAVGRLFAGIRGAMVVAAGTIKYNFAKFVIADGMAALVSGGLFLYLGYKFGQAEGLHAVAERIHKDGVWVFGGIALIVIAFVAWKIVSAKKDKVERLAEQHEAKVGTLNPRIGEPPIQLKGD